MSVISIAFISISQFLGGIPMSVLSVQIQQKKDRLCTVLVLLLLFQLISAVVFIDEKPFCPAQNVDDSKQRNCSKIAAEQLVLSLQILLPSQFLPAACVPCLSRSSPLRGIQLSTHLENGHRPQN